MSPRAIVHQTDPARDQSQIRDRRRQDHLAQRLRATERARQLVMDGVPADLQLAGDRGRAVVARQVDQAQLLGKRQPAPPVKRERGGRRRRRNRGFLARRSR
jgi:hypothetical protein